MSDIEVSSDYQDQKKTKKQKNNPAPPMIICTGFH